MKQVSQYYLFQCESKFDVEDSSDQPYCIKDFDNDEILKDFGPDEDEINDIIVNTNEVNKRDNSEEENARNKRAKTNVHKKSTSPEKNSNVENISNETVAQGSNSGIVTFLCVNTYSLYFSIMFHFPKFRISFVYSLI